MSTGGAAVFIYHRPQRSYHHRASHHVPTYIISRVCLAGCSHRKGNYPLSLMSLLTTFSFYFEAFNRKCKQYMFYTINGRKINEEP